MKLKTDVSPTAFFACVLLLQPALQGLVVLEQCARIELALAGEHLERFRPRLARPQAQHSPQAFAGLRVAVNRALVQRTVVTGRLAKPAVKLELKDAGQKVAGIGNVGGDVILGARIKVLLA